MGFTTNDSRVRVDFFKPSGKWYGTGSIDMRVHYNGPIHDCVRQACEAEQALGSRGEWGHTFTPAEWLAGGGSIVCLEPHHEHSHPIILRGPTA
jgi:hypothetical protein